MAKKVLVVEDDSNIAELLRLYLEKDGFDVFLAADGGEGIRRAQELQPDLILQTLIFMTLYLQKVLLVSQAMQRFSADVKRMFYIQTKN